MIEYRGFLIVADRAGDGFNIYDSDGDLFDEGYASLDHAKQAVDVAYIEFGL